nr:Chain C, GENE TERMINAL PROTEIN (MEMBRANE PROTEIN LMP-2A/LMP-2B) [human gammaherpesvirus 4]1UXW_C Chain C, GENE TERMINAL PROTEIN (MEMBRANE PROTEIN LMP-2A/LMP-2B) [human gammaherpesvirus 4]3BVN_C Chain C, Latent membrane protein 2 peptide [synthetic construct]3BVN_F Chain F, Latent membrane protein 2 peptide [synthetic construct]
RRRWRRLTV